MDRVQESPSCLECFLCQNVCHVLRDHYDFYPEPAEQFQLVLGED